MHDKTPNPPRPPVRIVFFGTPQFAVPSLQALVKANLAPLAVVTQPAKPVGRMAVLTPSPVEQTAKKLGIPVATPHSIKTSEFIEWMRRQQPDVAILVAYGKILPDAILQIPTRGFINVHPSLLPKHRGAAPVAGAILAGDSNTGVSIMQLDSQMDHGPVYAQKAIAVAPKATTGDLSDELSHIGADLLAKTIPKILSNQINPKQQNHSAATYTSLLKRTNGDINWTLDAASIERMVRAYTPWPGTYTCLHGERLKIIKVANTPTPHQKPVAQKNDTSEHAPGQLIVAAGRLFVGTGDGKLELITVQPAGKQVQSAREFLNGHTDLQNATVTSCSKTPHKHAA